MYIDSIPKEELQDVDLMEEHIENIEQISRTDSYSFLFGITTVEELKQIHEFLIKNKPEVSSYEREEEEEEEEELKDFS